MRIDAHHHVWDLAVRDQPWTADFPVLRRTFAMPELLRLLSENQIDATVVVQTLPIVDETIELLAMAATTPQIRGVVGWLDLSAADVEHQIGELQALPGGNKLAGIRHPAQDESDPGWLCRADVCRGIAAIGSAGLIYDLLVRPPQMAAAIATARALPETRFILDHAGKPRIASGEIRPWEKDIAEMAALPNVAIKLSGLVTEANPQSWTATDLRPYVDVIVESFRPERVAFGSDWPVCLVAGGYAGVLSAAEQLTSGLTASERADVFGGTAARWYGLDLQ